MHGPHDFFALRVEIRMRNEGEEGGNGASRGLDGKKGGGIKRGRGGKRAETKGKFRLFFSFSVFSF